MNNQIDANIYLGKVALYVKDIKKMTAFYQEIIGLEILFQTDSKVLLGIAESQTPLLELIENVTGTLGKRQTGLYHTAFLLPNRAALGSFLAHLLASGYPILGASDHGYSEAIYLQDPEDNGIEVYRDKEQAVWDIRPDGKIEGITIQMDAEGVLAAKQIDYEKIPLDSKIGHVHLTVQNLDVTEAFYKDILGFDLKSNQGRAKFFAAGDYHHHIGTNNWAGRQIALRDDMDLGLAYFTIVLPNETAWQKLAANLSLKGIDMLLDKDKMHISLKDPNQINIEIVVQS